MKYQETHTLLDAKAINLTLGGTRILEDVNLQIKDIVQTGQIRGQIHCLLGPSGVGKTLFLRILAGLLQPDTGSVRVASDGQNLIPVEAGLIGVVFQDYPLFDHLTIIKNLILGGTVSGLSSSQAKTKARELLDQFGLNSVYGFFPKQLSGGQRQRIAVIQQIMVERTFILMDEPFSGLDPSALKKIINLIHGIAASHEAKTIIFTTHDIGSAVQISDYIHIMGKTYDAQGNQSRAGHFVESINLLDQGIAWVDNNKTLPHFNKTVMEIEDKFDHI